MILEEETKDAFRYYSSELLPKSNKHILAYCDFCGKFKVTSKAFYHTFCNSCSLLLGEKSKGNKNPMFERTGDKAPNFGLHRTEETKALMSAARKGEKSYNWKGGISFEPYCAKFNDAFKEYIRSKFGYKCFLCPTTQAENGRKLSVHHVNYNTNCGCDGDETCNFVPLCICCHSKTNNNRDYWQKLITKKLYCMIIGWDV